MATPQLPAQPQQPVYSEETQCIQAYLIDTEPVFARLYDLRQKGWKSPAWDAYFNQQRDQADNADEATQQKLFEAMIDIGFELNEATGVFTMPASEVVAPGTVSKMLVAVKKSVLPTSSEDYEGEDQDQLPPGSPVAVTEAALLAHDSQQTSSPDARPDITSARSVSFSDDLLEEPRSGSVSDLDSNTAPSSYTFISAAGATVNSTTSHSIPSPSIGSHQPSSHHPSSLNFFSPGPSPLHSPPRFSSPPPPPPFAVLDLCLAPGGYTRALQLLNPTLPPTHGITLPPCSGGHLPRIPHNTPDAPTTIHFLDITLLALEFPAYWQQLNAPEHPHPNRENFLTTTVLEDELFDLIVCDGQVLRTHKPAGDVEHSRSTREILLRNSQLVFALRRVRNGGSMVVLLHKLDEYETVLVLREFAGFADVVLFKPADIHASRSSFYLVARNIQRESEAARAAVKRWELQWFVAWYDGTGLTEEDGPLWEEVRRLKDMMVPPGELLEEFGEELRRLGRGAWGIQEEALLTEKFHEKRVNVIRGLKSWRA